jgi:hypothetical protein
MVRILSIVKDTCGVLFFTEDAVCRFPAPTTQDYTINKTRRRDKAARRQDKTRQDKNETTQDSTRQHKTNEDETKQGTWQKKGKTRPDKIDTWR